MSMGSEREQVVRLEGRLTVREVPRVYQQYRHWKDKGTPAAIDLAALTAADSSAVALLLEWLSWARRGGDSIDFANPPESMRTIAALSDVDGLLGWSDGQ